MREPDFTPDPEILARLRRERGESQNGHAVEHAEPPASSAPATPGGFTVPVMVTVPAAHVAPVLDAQAQGLYNDLAKTYVASNVHASVALYALELLRASIIVKEQRRIGFPGAK